jgi:hypothetical protein
MGQTRSAGWVYRSVALGPVCVAFAAVGITHYCGNLAGVALENAIVMKLILALLIWLFAAWVARRMTIGSISGLRLKS